MRHARHLATVLLLVLLTACGSEPFAAPPPDADGGITAAAVHYGPEGGVAFLPPVGGPANTKNFYPDASLEIVITYPGGVDPLLVMSSGDGAIRVQNNFYQATWQVSDTVADLPPAVTTVTVSVFGRDLEGAVVAEACALEDPCLLGSFDAAIRRSPGQRTGGDVLDLTRTRTLPIKVYLERDGLRPEQLSDLVRLSDGLPFDVDDVVIRNCVVNGFNMPGQGLNALGAGLNALGAGLNALGAVGGMFLFSPGADSTAPDIRIFDPAEASAVAAGLVGPSEEYRDAAILVVDDFGADGSSEPVLALDPSLLSPAAGLSVAQLESLIAGGGFSHGALVLHQVVAMVEEAGFMLVDDPWGGWFRVYARPVSLQGDGFNFEGPSTDYLVVAAVDTRDYVADVVETNLVAPRIRNALDALRYVSEQGTYDGFDVLRVAINMSFVIVPCAVFEDYDGAPARYKIETFEDYVAALGAENAVAEDFYDELTALLLEPLGGGDEPLLQEIESCTVYEDEQGFLGPSSGTALGSMEDPYEPPYVDPKDWRKLVESGPGNESSWPCPDGETSPSVVYVASSGNFGLDYPMFPAAWPLVVGVSSQDGAEPDGFDTTASSFSNSGEVMAPGALFELGRSSDTNPSRVLAYAGTSFAAPVVSLFTALDQMAPWPACAEPTYSRLIGSDADDTDNVELGEAVDRRCWQLE